MPLSIAPTKALTGIICVYSNPGFFTATVVITDVFGRTDTDPTGAKAGDPSASSNRDCTAQIGDDPAMASAVTGAPTGIG